MTYDSGSQPPGPEWNAPPPRPPGAAGGPYIAPNPYGWPTNGREHPNGTTILVLGILSLVACGVLGPFAWAMGNTAIREMNTEPGANWTNRGNVTAGRVCGIIGTCFLILGVLMMLLWIGLFASIATR